MHALVFLADWTWSWDALTALATIALTIVTAVLAYGVPMELRRARRDERFLFYAQLDRTYFEIQKLLIERPYLENRPDRKRSETQEEEYNAFAFIVWNFLESIFDYGEQDRVLLETWSCIFEYEGLQHLDWFRRGINSHKFKERFRKHVTTQFHPHRGKE